MYLYWISINKQADKCAVSRYALSYMGSVPVSGEWTLKKNILGNPSDNLERSIGCPSDDLVVSDDRTTVKIEPWLYSSLSLLTAVSKHPYFYSTFQVTRKYDSVWKIIHNVGDL